MTDIFATKICSVLIYNKNNCFMVCFGFLNGEIVVTLNKYVLFDTSGILCTKAASFVPFQLMTS